MVVQWCHKRSASHTGKEEWDRRKHEGGSAMAAAQRGGSSRSVSGAPATRWAARFALVGIIGTVYFVVALITMHFLRPDDIVRYGGNSIGFYSVGPYGSIFV